MSRRHFLGIWGLADREKGEALDLLRHLPSDLSAYRILLSSSTWRTHSDSTMSQF